MQFVDVVVVAAAADITVGTVILQDILWQTLIQLVYDLMKPNHSFYVEIVVWKALT